LVQGRQISLDAPEGCGVLINLESLKKMPTLQQFQTEAEGFALKQKDVKITKAEPAQRLTADLDKFALEMDAKGTKVRMEYYLLRQAKGGVTLAARIQGSDPTMIQKEINTLTRGLTLMKTIEREP
jgi:hypothetical protein